MQAFFQRVSTIKRAARGRTGNNAARRVADTEQCSAPRGRHKTKKHFAGRAKKVERRSAVPPVFFHIHAAVLAKSHAFRFEKPPLLMPARCGPAHVVYHAVAGIIAVKLCHAEDFSD